MIRIGITGGIGSGKSVVSRILSLYQIPVYIADDESKKLTNSSLIIREKLTDLLGTDIYTEKGLNKPLLATSIFGNKMMLEKVNQIIHPVVNRHFNEWCKSQNAPCCAIESAILFESGFDKSVDLSLMVYAPTDVRIERAILRDQTSKEALLKRINSQISDEQKKEWADYTIINDGKQALLPQIKKFLEQKIKSLP